MARLSTGRTKDMNIYNPHAWPVNLSLMRRSRHELPRDDSIPWFFGPHACSSGLQIVVDAVRPMQPEHTHLGNVGCLPCAHVTGDAAVSGAGGHVGGEDVVGVPVEVLAGPS